MSDGARPPGRARSAPKKAAAAGKKTAAAVKKAAVKKATAKKTAVKKSAAKKVASPTAVAQKAVQKSSPRKSVAKKAVARQGAAPEVTIVMPTYKRPERLAGVVEALSRQSLDPGRFELVAVDNFSEDDTFETLQRLADSVPFTMRVLQTTSNHGPAPARNLGWRAAEAPVVAFLDDDCLPDPEWLETGLSAMTTDERLGVLQGRVRLPDDFDPEGMPNWYHCQIIESPTPYFEACNIFYRRAALEETGGFDESIGWWGEDSALGWSVVGSGWRRDFTSGASVVHAVVERGWRWHYDNSLLDRNLIKLAAQYPEFRKEAFWKHWAVRRTDVSFMIAVLSVLVALKFRPALLLALPYLARRRPHWDFEHPLLHMAQEVALDAAHTAGTLQGAVQSRVLVI